MSSTRFYLAILTLIGWNTYTTAAEAQTQLSPTVVSFFRQYCYRCHGKTMQKGDRRLDQLPATMTTSSDSAALLEEALDAINRGDMPPAKKGIVQPPSDETRQVVAEVTGFL